MISSSARGFFTFSIVARCSSVLAWFASRPLARVLLPEIASGNFGSFLTVIPVLAVVAGAATLPPLLRAIHLDPGIALRYE